jgi:hypothetical protein
MQSHPYINLHLQIMKNYNQEGLETAGAAPTRRNTFRTSLRLLLHPSRGVKQRRPTFSYVQAVKLVLTHQARCIGDCLALVRQTAARSALWPPPPSGPLRYSCRTGLEADQPLLEKLLLTVEVLMDVDQAYLADVRGKICHL